MAALRRFRRSYQLPLVGPLRLGALAIGERRGWILREGEHLADVAPLPHFSRESREEVEAAFGEQAAPPSLAWARHALPWTGAASAKTAGLVLGDGEPQPGHDCVKVKVGRQALDLEVERVRQLAARGVRLRLDGNRSLSLESAGALAEAAGDALEFLEEPVPGALVEASLLRWPVALDETLVALGEVPSGAAAFVLKPTLLGPERTLQLIELARERALPVVISSAFESAIGRADLIRFAASVAPEVAHGLGTGPAFARDFPGFVRPEGQWLHAQDATLEADEEHPWVAF